MIDHSKSTNLQDTDKDDSPRYYGVRIYRTEEDVLKQFEEGMCLSGFMVKYFDQLVIVLYSIGLTEADCVMFARGKSLLTDLVCGLQFTLFKQF